MKRSSLFRTTKKTASYTPASIVGGGALTRFERISHLQTRSHRELRKRAAQRCGSGGGDGYSVPFSLRDATSGSLHRSTVGRLPDAVRAFAFASGTRALGFVRPLGLRRA